MTSNTRLFLATILAIAYACTAATPNYAMEFHSSSFLVNRGNSVAPHGISVPVMIQLVDSEGKPDTSDSTTVITASISSGTISGNVAQVSNGVASFMMTFTSCVGGVITFTAQSPSANNAVHGKTLKSGTISIAAVANSELMFDAASPLQAGQPLKVPSATGAKLDAFKINLYDSCGAVDHTMTGLTVTASISQGSLAGETTATFTDGVAIFSNLIIPEAFRGAQITFTVGMMTTPVAAAHKSITTGGIEVHKHSKKDRLHLDSTPIVAGFIIVCLALLGAVLYAVNTKPETPYIIVPTVSTCDSCQV